MQYFVFKKMGHTENKMSKMTKNSGNTDNTQDIMTMKIPDMKLTISDMIRIFFKKKNFGIEQKFLFKIK